jgi:hypothetical protein
MIATTASTALAGATIIITRLRRNANSKMFSWKSERGSLAAPPFAFYFVVSEAR